MKASLPDLLKNARKAESRAISEICASGRLRHELARQAAFYRRILLKAINPLTARLSRNS
jgi:hypothetical protein